MAAVLDRYSMASSGKLEVAASSGDLLPPALVELLEKLHQNFEPARRERLRARRQRQQAYDTGRLPEFRTDTASIRAGHWRVAKLPEAVRDRRVEITGPVERKIVINALNSGARVFMADFEDSLSPVWEKILDGQRNLIDAVHGDIRYVSADGREYQLDPNPAVLMVRPRGLHLPERHVQIDGQSFSAALFDAAVFLYWNAKVLLAKQRGPYLYLPKLEAMEEARWWNAVLACIESTLDLPKHCIKVTVLIETLPAAFEMDEILYALRDRILGLNCGRWDYIFSTIKTLRGQRDRILPDRDQVTMQTAPMRAYAKHLIRVCHRRGAMAMGGMAADIPDRRDAAATALTVQRVQADKLREVKLGHDGTWVAHPGLVAVAQAVFDQHMPGPNQLNTGRGLPLPGADELLARVSGTITREGFVTNVVVVLGYLAAWLGGNGCVPIQRRMEDAATAEIGRAQLWQWLHADELEFSDHTAINFAYFEMILATQSHRLIEIHPAAREHIETAAQLLGEWTRADTLADFLTLAAYPLLDEPIL